MTNNDRLSILPCTGMEKADPLYVCVRMCSVLQCVSMCCSEFQVIVGLAHYAVKYV